MQLEGLVVYIKLDGNQDIWEHMIDRSHPDYTVLPTKIATLQETVNTSFEHMIPLMFRYLYACREFDFIGVFKHASDREVIMKQIREYVADHNIGTLKINSCYGEVVYPSGDMELKELVHKMSGKAVIGAVKQPIVTEDNE